MDTQDIVIAAGPGYIIDVGRRHKRWHVGFITVNPRTELADRASVVSHHASQVEAERYARRLAEHITHVRQVALGAYDE